MKYKYGENIDGPKYRLIKLELSTHFRAEADVSRQLAAGHQMYATIAVYLSEQQTCWVDHDLRHSLSITGVARRGCADHVCPELGALITFCTRSSARIYALHDSLVGARDGGNILRR